MMIKCNRKHSHLHSSHVIANHILVSFHVAFISSLLNIPPDLYGPGVLRFVFFSYETIISAIFWFVCFQAGVAIHEMGHYLQAVKVNALTETLLPAAKMKLEGNLLTRIFWYLSMFIAIPWGAFRGVKREGLTYYPEAPFNLSVAAAGPRTSRNLAIFMLPCAAIFLIIGLVSTADIMIYPGRLCLGLAAVGLIDFLLADPGKYHEYRKREARAQEKAGKTAVSQDAWLQRVASLKSKMISTRMKTLTLSNGEKLSAPWQFRNCGMGGRHTEKEYPESNISFQELMFIPLCAKDYEEAQMITVTLQTRLKEIIEKESNARVMGIGLEGGLAPYVGKAPHQKVPEQRVWSLAVQAIKDSGYTPGEDIVIAYDHAASELSNTYREEFKQEDAVGMYYFWRSEEKVVMSRDQLLELCLESIETIPAVSIEDGFAEDDFEGWKALMQELGDKVFVIGDDLVTTNDAVIEKSADQGLINTALIKANQIGTLSETMIAMLTALGKGLEIVVSHRSKSPNDDMEAQVALSVNALGMKTGGGANTERLFKYGAVIKIMRDLEKHLDDVSTTATGDNVLIHTIDDLVITDIIAYEEPTNAGIPTVGVEVHVGIPGSEQHRKLLTFTGSTPLGTSAGMGEAIHLIDSMIERSDTTDKYANLFVVQPDKTLRFSKDVSDALIKEKKDSGLSILWEKAQRYNGKGCQNAVANVMDIIAPRFVNKRVADLTSITTLDKELLKLEIETAQQRGKLNDTNDENSCIEVMQRKGNLGMNAILSVSLALSRMIAHVQGKDLWLLMRETMEHTLAELFFAHKDVDEIKKAISKNKEEYIGTHTFEEMVMTLKKFEEHLHRQGKALYAVLRQYLPVYFH